MPALGSSVISTHQTTDKSGKKFAPKAPVRRPAPTTPTEPANSVEPPPVSQTSPPQTVQPTATSPDSTSPQDPTAADSIHAPHGGLVLRKDGNPAQEQPTHDAIREDGRNEQDLHKHKQGSISHDDHEQTQPTITVTTEPSPQVSAESSEIPQIASPANQHPQTPISNPINEPRIATSPEPASQKSLSNSVARTSLEPPHEDAPATKRRKVTPKQTRTLSRPRPNTNEDAPVPSSSTDLTTNTATSTIPTRASARKVAASAAKATTKSLARKRATPRERPSTARVVSISTSISEPRAEDAQPSTKARKPRQATRQRREQPLHDAAAEIVATAERTANRNKGRRSRKEREPTPEDAENETIVPGQVKMAELCRDTRKGKKSDMLRALQERDKEELLKKQQKELQQLVGNEAPAQDNERNDAANLAAENANPNGPAAGEVERRQELSRQVAGTYVNEDGEIMIDTDSLQVDRHAHAAAEREQGQLEAVEENYLSRPAVNSQTYMKREKANSWPEELTYEFYDALRMFGTDFDMIGRMLRKTRRAIKLKFTREERLDPDRINQALLGERIAVDVEDFSRRAGEELKETEEHERLMEEDRKRIEEDAANELRAKEDEDQLRKDQAEQECAANPDDSSGKENRENGKKKEKKKKRKKKGDDEGVANVDGMEDHVKQKKVSTDGKQEKRKKRRRKERSDEGKTTDKR
ncbi:MAG: hypothetical protein Q9221_008468 [Calogaya cf. arnoldii]